MIMKKEKSRNDTDHLLASKANRKRLLESIEQVKAGNTVTMDITKIKGVPLSNQE